MTFSLYLQVNEKFSPSLNGETENFSAAVKSLIELHRIIEKFNASDDQPEIAQLIATAVAKDSCKWVSPILNKRKLQGIPMNNANY